MVLTAFVAAVAVAHSQANQRDPNRLKIGEPGEATVQVGQLYDLRKNRPCTMADVVAATKGKRWLFLGENHATTAHQNLEALTLSALVGSGRRVAVGLEMYQRPMQSWLDQWTAGGMEEEDFLLKSNWKEQWGFDFAFYRPVFQAVQMNHLPLEGLNVPRTWVRAVAKGGFAGLPEDAMAQLPNDMFLGNRIHRTVYDALIGGHPMGDASMMDNMYAAQVLWDEGMADTALKFTRGWDRGGIFVVIAGSGHVLYKQGINYRVAKRGGGEGVTLVMMQGSGPATVSRGIGDFVYVSQEAPQAK